MVTSLCSPFEKSLPFLKAMKISSMLSSRCFYCFIFHIDTYKPLKGDFSVWYKLGVKIYFILYAYPIYAVPFIEKTIFTHSSVVSLFS